ncbi:hypothetical protein UFOVP151_20 [uncultured Caudovirales phage]|uniref:Uncharacterized protein n=1 Tax=uncultured Caudovirales phage TaxID=2100421 RepID=A0A6J7WF87_9CAUD|nr:hypothetical protein UFOVP151_20 [uncultured Caudovirales phage]
MKEIEIANILPAEAIAQLQRAALTPITTNDPLARVKAIEQAVKRVKRNHPQYFTEFSK